MIAVTIALPNHPVPVNNDESTIEVFDHIGDAMVAMFERYHAEGRTILTANYLDGSIANIIHPAYGEGAEFTCYEVAGPLYGEPTEEQVMDALTDVHSGVWGWKLTLTPDFDGRMTIAVQANRY